MPLEMRHRMTIFSAEMLEIRDETPQDFAAIRDVHVLAFGSSAEAVLVDRLHAANKAVISRVATIDRSFVGHILFCMLRNFRTSSSEGK